MTSIALDSKPETAAEALARWDSGQSVFTVEMGGLGPGYEQVIHIMAFEVIRELLSRGPLDWYFNGLTGDDEAKQKDRAFAEDVDRVVLEKVKHLGSSGAQWGAARSVAYRVVRIGWAAALDELPPDRLIQVSKNWPGLAVDDGRSTSSEAVEPSNP